MGEVALGDVIRAVANHDPGLGELLVRYMAQEDPKPGVPEVAAADAAAPELPEGAWTLDRLLGAVSESGLRGKTATERRIARRDSFDAATASAYAPPRLALGRLLIDLYRGGDPADHEALAFAFANGELRWGAWQAAKAVYKLAEAAHDARMWGVLAWRFDGLTAGDTGMEVGGGTLTYLRRRAWRFLRLLGLAVPELYPTFAVEVLRHYRADHSRSSWIAPMIFSYATARTNVGPTRLAAPAEKALKDRAFVDVWKRTPAPLLRLLDLAENEEVCAFAIRSLKVDHPLALRAVEPAWLARLGARPIGALHAFVVGLIKDNPDLHGSRLRDVGLESTVVSFLRSSDAGARAFAVEHVRANVSDLPTELLLELAASRDKAVLALALSKLEALAPSLPLPVLAKLLAISASRELAATQIRQRFSPAELPLASFVELAYSGDAVVNWVVEWFNTAKVGISGAVWRAVLADPRRNRQTVRWAMGNLGKLTAASIGADWVRTAVEDAMLRPEVLKWLEAGKFKGADLDVDWVKGFLPRPPLRPTALRVLADGKVVAPSRLGVDWLLSLVASSDPELHTFAESVLLQGFGPDDFGATKKEGLARLWTLARSPKERLRIFACTWLRLHHPTLGPKDAELAAIGVKPKLKLADYTMDVVGPLLDEPRIEPRRLATAIAREQLVDWGDRGLVYTLAGSRHAEPRRVGCELLLGALVDPPAVDALPADWLDGAQLFVLAESAQKYTRETALAVIRQAYDRVGSPERLAWLMEAADRDVRIFAVRLFWERHRPRHGGPASAFTDTAAIRQFLRTTLYGLPPGRVERRVGAAEAAAPAARPMPASVGKRRLVEALRDIAANDAAFAEVVVPVFTEFTASTAKGEWQACVSALATIKAAHGAALGAR
jgi:hypothetical protein